ncbi:MAG: hypothetical protein GY749_30945, partial [Desulfobacteraceae bacterium]|nr:hypothetical protein [Desulfobacteraceae bacterium]
IMTYASQFGWEHEGMLTLTSSLDFGKFKGDVSKAQGLISWVAGEAGWDGQATLNLISKFGKSEFIKDIESAKAAVTWIAEQSEDWNGASTLQLISSVDTNAWGTDIESAKAAVTWIAEQSEDWNGASTLQLISSVDTNAWGTDVESAKAALTWIGENAGWDGLSTMYLVSQLKDTEALSWAAIEQTLKDHGVDNTTLVKDIQSVYAGDITFDELKYVTDGKLPESVTATVSANASVQVTAQLAENTKLNLLDGINTGISNIADGVGVSLMNSDKVASYFSSIGGLPVAIQNAVSVNSMPGLNFPEGTFTDMKTSLSTIASWQAGTSHRHGGVIDGSESGYAYMGNFHGKELVVSPTSNWPVSFEGISENVPAESELAELIRKNTKEIKNLGKKLEKVTSAVKRKELKNDVHLNIGVKGIAKQVATTIKDMNNKGIFNLK